MDKFEEYKLFVDDTARFSDRRQTANNLYLTTNSIAISAIAFLVKDAGLMPFWQAVAVIVMLFAGILICLQWKQMIRKYKNLVGFRINELRKLENQITDCHKMYYAENEIYPRDANDMPIHRQGLNFSDLELMLPWVFIGVYSAFLVITVSGFIFVPEKLGIAR